MKFSSDKVKEILSFWFGEDISYDEEVVLEELHRQVPQELKKLYQVFLDYAINHKVIIDRFARFPHRNEILGRKSTSEELQFLRQPGSHF